MAIKQYSGFQMSVHSVEPKRNLLIRRPKPIQKSKSLPYFFWHSSENHSKTKTLILVTLTNHRRHRQSNEPIKPSSRYACSWRKTRVKRVCDNSQSALVSLLVNDKVARVFCGQYYFWHSNENWSICHECVNRKQSLSIVEFLSWEMFLISRQEEKNQVQGQTPRTL